MKNVLAYCPDILVSERPVHTTARNTNKVSVTTSAKCFIHKPPIRNYGPAAASHVLAETHVAGRRAQIQAKQQRMTMLRTVYDAKKARLLEQRFGVQLTVRGEN